MLLATVKKSTKVFSLKILVKTAVKRNLSEKSDATYTMTIIERNFNGTVYRVTVKEEGRLVEEEHPTLEQPRVTGIAAEETGPEAPSGLEAPIVKVISVEVKVGLERGVLLQRWQQEGGESQVVQEQDGDDIGFLGALHQGGPGWRGD